MRKTADKSKNKNNLGRQENAASATVYVQHPQLGSARGNEAIRQLGNKAIRNQFRLIENHFTHSPS